MSSRWTDTTTKLIIYFRPTPIEVGLLLPLISFATYWGGELFFHLIR
jgi:hypothetical protein